MFIPRIYYPHPLQIDTTVTLDKVMCHYLTQVLRLKEGETLILFNGEGGQYLGQCHFMKKVVQVALTTFENINRESTLQLHLGQGLVRGDRMDWVIQKATELGVQQITPLISALCNVKLDEERSQKRLVHWQNIAISACEQSGRTQLPIIHPPLPLAKWVAQSFQGTSLVFDTNSDVPLKNLLPNNSFRLAIGPESGWQWEEIQWMVAQGFTACSLGPRILRTETAPIVALGILQGLFGY